jgi:hypothetical protein
VALGGDAPSRFCSFKLTIGVRKWQERYTYAAGSILISAPHRWPGPSQPGPVDGAKRVCQEPRPRGRHHPRFGFPSAKPMLLQPINHPAMSLRPRSPRLEGVLLASRQARKPKLIIPQVILFRPSNRPNGAARSVEVGTAVFSSDPRRSWPVLSVATTQQKKENV